MNELGKNVIDLKEKKEKTIGQISIDAQLLYERLVKAEVEEFISYSELSQIIGRNVQTDARCMLNTARRKAHRENKIIFGVVFGKGLKRAKDEEIAMSGTASIRKISREARRRLKIITCVQDFDSLSDAAKLRHNTDAALLNCFQGMTQNNNIKKLEAKVSEVGNKLPLVKTLEAFIRKTT